MRHNRATNRHNEWKKALRKRQIVRHVYGFQDGWYDNLHQYSKNKIHCSCPLCACKTRRRHTYGPAECWCMQDTRRLDAMKYQLDELDEEE